MGALVNLRGDGAGGKAALKRRSPCGGADDERGFECVVGDGGGILYYGFVCAADS